MAKKDKKMVEEEVKEEAPVEEPAPVAEPEPKSKGKLIYTANGPMMWYPDGSMTKITE